MPDRSQLAQARSELCDRAYDRMSLLRQAGSDLLRTIRSSRASISESQEIIAEADRLLNRR
ncbi:MAG TPA: hypothetical protein VFB45_26575 [Pseudolabrys sp.]|nr:hypothetical protein [Pseudolabrys sp.]